MSWADAVVSEHSVGSTATLSDGGIATANGEGIAPVSCCHGFGKAATDCETLAASDELVAKAGPTGEQCRGCGQPMVLTTGKAKQYGCNDWQDVWCFVCHDCNLWQGQGKNGKVGGNRRRM